MNQVVIWGCGGHAREVAWLCEQAGLTVKGFLDERPEFKGKIVDDLPVLGTLNDIAPFRDEVQVVCAGVGDPSLKQRFARATVDAGFRIARAIVHPDVEVSARSIIEAGSVVCAGVTLTVNVRVARHVIVNRNATLGHDVSVGEFATIAPGAIVSGNVEIGAGVYVGTNAAIREKVIVNSWSVIGGCSFVRDDIPAGTLYAGVPATLKKRLR